jgi:hypothetical protein
VGSEESSSGSNEPVCRFCGTAKPTSSASAYSQSGGPESRATRTCERFWATPTAHPRTHTPRQVDHGQQLANQVAGIGCACRCHTSMSSAAGSPARTSVLPAAEQASLGPGRVFGSSSLGSLGNYDPATSSLRTSQLSLLEDSTGSLQTLPRSGSMRNGTVYRHQPLAPLTGGTASGSWPTPDAGMFGLGADPERFEQRREKLKAKGINGNGAGTPLAIAVQQREEFPMPTSSNTKAHHMRSGGRPARSYGASGQLNPTWVEWLMGFPLGWTVCERWETRSSRRSRSGSAAGSSRGSGSSSG